MDTVARTHQDIITLYNITSSLYNTLSYQQIILHICSILVNLNNSLYYMREVTMHTMAYINADTTGIPSPHVLPVEDLRMMLVHIEEVLPLTMHLPDSSEDTLHFYGYLCTHILTADEQFLLFINVPIQNHAQQIEKYNVFNLVIPHTNFSACYNIDSKYLGTTYDKIKTEETSKQQFSICQRANRQFCSIDAPFQPLTNPPSCITAVCTKNNAGIKKRCSLQIRNTNSISIPKPIAPNVWILTSAPTVVSTGIMFICPEAASRFIKTQTTIHILQLLPACSATSQHFHLPP